MEKIKITREQEEALKVWNSYQEKLETFVKERGMWTQSFKPLNNFTPEQFALLLCGWYEVEQPLNVGDWVFDKDLHKYRQIDRESWTTDRTVPLKTVVHLSSSFEKIEEPWKIMLLELGREKPEFKIGDKISAVENDHFTITSEQVLERAYKNAQRNDIVYFYPVESRIELKEENK